MDAWVGIVGAEFARPGTDADAVDGVVPVSVARPANVGEVQSLMQGFAIALSLKNLALMFTGVRGFALPL